MDDEADAAREYERLRAELAEFVLGVLSERIASGQEPELSQALIDAIDRRVDAAVSARLGKLGPADAERASRRSTPVRKIAPEPVNRGRLIVYGLIGVAALAAIAFVVLRHLPASPTNTITRNAATGNETTIIQVENGQIASPGNVVQGNQAAPPATPQPGPGQPN